MPENAGDRWEPATEANGSEPIISRRGVYLTTESDLHCIAWTALSMETWIR